MVVRACRLVLLLSVLCALALALVAPSALGADRIYWTSFNDGKVHWSNLDGSGGSGKVAVLVKPKGAKKEKLAELGMLKAVVRLTYTPPDGATVSLRKRLTLKQD